MKDTIVLYPAYGSGHLMSMVELGKLILTHHPSFSITILILTPPNNKNNDSTTQYIASISNKFPSINFHFIPSISLTLTLPPHLQTLELSPLCNHHVHNIFQSISKTTNIKGVILDFLNYSASQINNILDIPTYFYFTSAASMLSLFLHLPTYHKKATKAIKDFNIDTPIELPGLPTLFVDDYPDDGKDPTSPGYQTLLECAKVFRESDGVIINTFDAFESKAIKALRDGSCVPDGTSPLIFCIGPVISTLYDTDEHQCMSWLDLQPCQSVVLLSFGSMGRFSKAQLNEIALGLEKSKQIFLWVVRSELDLDELSLDELLPEGFLERTKEKGMVVRNWAPQRAILSHDSVGGLVTHCGWNSILEAICEGVPMITWPLYAEQNLNRVILVKETKIALKLNESADKFVSASELGERVIELMESDKGKNIRERILKMKISANEARGGSGSSLVDLKRLGDSWKELDSCNKLSPNSPFLIY
ncbi:UDP-glycosyltransferase 1 [Cicer arietinum]|uniref:Glycosyltransferase n=1 Tax=Cicer arietinum TaxID=3827 RepID=A0A067XTD3_CICAR|nr:UDP-glycosyltransferase 1 [Cicer arietinum]AGU14153.1 UDP-glycosyltransferase [Cicer arietinum]